MGARGRGKRPRTSKDVGLLAHGKGPVKRTQLNPYDAAGSDNITYVVEKVFATRTTYGEPQWLIQWEGLPKGSDTWEPLVNLSGCDDLISEFKAESERERAEIDKKAAEEKEKRASQNVAPDAEADEFEDAGDNLRSPYWKHFKVKKEGKKIVAYVCKLCGPNASVKEYCGNTSNLRTHLTHCHKNVAVDIKEEGLGGGGGGGDPSGDTSTNGSTQHRVDALIPHLSSEQRNRLHRKIALWLVRRGRRPLTLPEKDIEFKDIFNEIFMGSYTTPCYHTVMEHVLALSAEGRVKLRESTEDLLREGILPSIGGDIWSQGAATKRACAAMGIGEYVEANEATDTIVKDTVKDNVHCTVSDNASNIVNAWTCFDGHECNDHTLALIVKEFLEQERVKKVFAKLRGMTGHFNLSVIGTKLLYDCQKRRGLGESKPPQDNDTRSDWGGACKQATWYVKNKLAIMLYDTENTTKASIAVPNLDGSVYKDRQLEKEEWDIVKECVYVLQYASTVVDLLQGTEYPTANVREAREKMYNAIVRRYFKDFMDCKLEDFAVATVCDPRYKSFAFKSATSWMRGELTMETAYRWARHAWAADLKPQPMLAQEPANKKSRGKAGAIVTGAAFLDDSDEEEDSEAVGAQSLEPEADELSVYLGLPDVKSSCDIQEWWRQNTGRFPNLAKMARQFLGAPASTAGVERAFSKVTSMHSDLRKRLSEGTIEHSLMAAMNT
ncbi:hypothetical protein CYMTET_8460 [Cymbomonas tetramitiformis]|uniref:Uncharacterized protein n=1 Tax=Cymbomonas tetramitiformis TaxID=36881 RepID=A0AAE0LGG4_9CHLO|nr:hypothetical protein CYMTET_8460 [Cymbomonas tetramitiformis]